MAETLKPATAGSSFDSAITAADICTSCGLCCTGALFLYGELETHELPLVDHLGLKLWPENGAPALAFPCPAAVGRCCTVYPDRPQVCRKYRCEVLNDVDRGVLGGERAIEIVVEAVALAEAANEGYPADILQQRRDHIANPEGWRDGPAETLADRLRRRLALHALEHYLNTHFRAAEQTGLQPDSPSFEPSGACLNPPSGSGQPTA